MSEFMLADRDEIVKSSISRLREYMNGNAICYELKCMVIIVLMQYMFALYYKSGRIERMPGRDGSTTEWVKVFTRNILHAFADDKGMVNTIVDLSNARNAVAHAMYVKQTESLVETVWESDKFNELLIMYGIIDKPASFNAATLMSGD